MTASELRAFWAGAINGSLSAAGGTCVANGEVAIGATLILAAGMSIGTFLVIRMRRYRDGK